MNIVICDDEKSFLDLISEHVTSFYTSRQQTVHIHQYTSGKQLLLEGVEDIDEADAILLDLQMDISGIINSICNRCVYS